MGVVALGAAAGCFLSQQDDTASSPDEVVSAGDVSAVLKSTLVLKGGCVATKIGPKHLLTAARCVVGNPAYAAGKVLDYKVASTGGQTLAPPAATDAGATDDDASAAPDDDAGADAGTTKDGGASDAGSSSSAPTIASVQIPASFTTKCKTGSCNLDAIDASDAPDIAVIVLQNELATVPTVPVDLDEVGEGDPLLVVSSGCGAVDAQGGKLVTAKTVAVPASNVAHKGSPYAASPQLAARVAASYVVTPGAGWAGLGAPRVCLGDLGAPAFRQTSAAVTGIFSNYTARTTSLKTPVTLEHTRVDQMSRFKIGPWLDSLGATTIHSCSESANGCDKHSFDGGTPDDATGGAGGDGGKGDAMAPPGDPDAGGTVDQPLPDDGNGDSPDPNASEPDYSDAAVAPKKKSSSKSGCSAAPNGGAGGSGVLVVGVGLAIAAIRRRKK